MKDKDILLKIQDHLERVIKISELIIKETKNWEDSIKRAINRKNMANEILKIIKGGINE